MCFKYECPCKVYISYNPLYINHLIKMKIILHIKSTSTSLNVPLINFYTYHQLPFVKIILWNLLLSLPNRLAYAPFKLRGSHSLGQTNCLKLELYLATMYPLERETFEKIDLPIWVLTDNSSLGTANFLQNAF